MTPQPQTEGAYGSLLHAPEFEAAPQVLSPEAFLRSALPARKTLDNLPSIARQGTKQHPGSPGSCEAQSFGYGLGSYTAARKPDGSIKWNAALPANQVSAAFLYCYEHHQEKRSCPQGSLALPYLQYLVTNGSPSALEISYKPVCSYLDQIPLDPHYPDMTRFCIGSFATSKIDINPDFALRLIKLLIGNGLAIAFSGPVLRGYGAPVFTDGVICETETIPHSGHGQLVVGYNDTIGPSSNPGAFLVQNSFGSEWPGAGSASSAPPGMAYWSYTTFTSTQKFAATAYPREEGPLSGSVLNASAGPAGCIDRAFQWAPETGEGVWLVLMLQFAAPVRLQTVTLTEPATGTSVTGQYGHSLANGYVYFKRTDGHQFVPGKYIAKLAVGDSSGAVFEYSGTVAVGAAQSGPPAQVLDGTTPVTDTIGAVAMIAAP